MNRYSSKQLSDMAEAWKIVASINRQNGLGSNRVALMRQSFDLAGVTDVLTDVQCTNVFYNNEILRKTMVDDYLQNGKSYMKQRVPSEVLTKSVEAQAVAPQVTSEPEPRLEPKPEQAAVESTVKTKAKRRAYNRTQKMQIAAQWLTLRDERPDLADNVLALTAQLVLPEGEALYSSYTDSFSLAAIIKRFLSANLTEVKSVQSYLKLAPIITPAPAVPKDEPVAAAIVDEKPVPAAAMPSHYREPQFDPEPEVEIKAKTEVKQRRPLSAARTGLVLRNTLTAMLSEEPSKGNPTGHLPSTRSQVGGMFAMLHGGRGTEAKPHSNELFDALEFIIELQEKLADGQVALQQQIQVLSLALDKKMATVAGAPDEEETEADTQHHVIIVFEEEEDDEVLQTSALTIATKHKVDIESCTSVKFETCDKLAVHVDTWASFLKDNSGKTLAILCNIEVDGMRSFLSRIATDAKNKYGVNVEWGFWTNNSTLYSIADDVFKGKFDVKPKVVKMKRR